VKHRCANCGTSFYGDTRRRYCSSNCRKNAKTQSERRCKEKKRLLWGFTGYKNSGIKLRDSGRPFEAIGTEVLSQLGFNDVWFGCEKNRGFLVDFIATYDNKRVLIDVTSGIRKNIKFKSELARALKMPLFILFISPDFSKYFLTPDVSHQNSVRLQVSKIKSIER